MAETFNVSGEFRRRKWNWFGHILTKDPADECVVALEWTNEGKRKRGGPKTMWMVERNMAGGMDFLEHSTPRGFIPQHVEGKYPCLMCVLARRKLRLGRDVATFVCRRD